MNRRFGILVFAAAAMFVCSRAFGQYTPIPCYNSNGSSPCASPRPGTTSGGTTYTDAAGDSLRHDLNDRFGGSVEIDPLLGNSTNIKNSTANYCVVVNSSNTGLTTNLCNAAAGSGDAIVQNQSGAALNSLLGSGSDPSIGDFEEIYGAGADNPGAGTLDDALTGYSVNGVINVATAPGFACAPSSPTVSSISGSNVVVSRDAGFKVGMSVAIPYAGASSTISGTPSLTVSPLSTDVHGHMVTSGCSAYTGITCATTYGYAIQQCAGAQNGACSAPSSTVYITAGASALSAGQENQLVSPVLEADIDSYKIYKCTGSSCTPTLYDAESLNWGHAYPSRDQPANISYDDFGGPIEGSYSTWANDNDAGTALPVSSTPGWYYGTISDCGTGGGAVGTACASTTFVVDSAPSNTVPTSYHLYLDDAPPVNAAIAKAIDAGTTIGGTVVRLPQTGAPCVYIFAQSVNLGAPDDTAGGQVQMTGPVSPTGAAIIYPYIAWAGPPTGTAFSIYRTTGALLSGVNLKGDSINTAAIGVDVDVPSGTTTVETQTANRVSGNSFYRVGQGIRVGNQYVSNDDNQTFDKNYVQYARRGISLYSINSRVIANAISHSIYGIVGTGSWSARNNDVTRNTVSDYWIDDASGPITISGGESEHSPRQLIITATLGAGGNFPLQPQIIFEGIRYYCSGTPDPAINDGAHGNDVQIVDESNGPLILRNNSFQIATSACTNYANYVIDGSPSSGSATIIAEGNTFTSLATAMWTGTGLRLYDRGSVALDTGTGDYSSIDACAGTAALSGGAGTVTSPCAVAGRHATCWDTTTPANAAIAAAVTGGSITVAGTGTDAVYCRVVD